jgi:IclR family transcriptional regulator, pca regulon regulatory protein
MHQSQNSDKPRYFVNALEKGLSVLMTFSRHKSPLRLSEIARHNSMNLPTASRYLKTLTDLGYLDFESSTETYTLTQQVASLGLSFLMNMDFRTKLYPHLVAISQEFKIATQCAILDGLEIVFVERVRGTELIDLRLMTGSRLPAYCTSQGRAILAYFENNKALELINKMDLCPLTPYTITDKQKLLAEIDRTFRRGYAQSIQEITMGFANYAVPIFKGGEVEGALGVTFSVSLKKNVEFRDALLNRLIAAGRKASI